MLLEARPRRAARRAPRRARGPRRPTISSARSSTATASARGTTRIPSNSANTMSPGLHRDAADRDRLLRRGHLPAADAVQRREVAVEDREADRAQALDVAQVAVEDRRRRSRARAPRSRSARRSGPTLPPGVVETSTESGVSRSNTSRYGRMRTMPSSQPTRGMSWPSTVNASPTIRDSGIERPQRRRQHLLLHAEVEERVADRREVEPAVALAELGRATRLAHDDADARSAISASSSACCFGVEVALRPADALPRRHLADRVEADEVALPAVRQLQPLGAGLAHVAAAPSRRRPAPTASPPPRPAPRRPSPCSARAPCAARPRAASPSRRCRRSSAGRGSGPAPTPSACARRRRTRRRATGTTWASRTASRPP